MKITPNPYRATLAERSQPAQPASSSNTKEAEAKKHPSSSEVALSSAARHLQQAHATDQDVNVERVQALREAIANGTMEIHTERIADGLIASTRELLNT